jgi:hypothetical protein
MPLTNLNKFHLLFYIAMGAGIAFALAVLVAPLHLRINHGRTLWWAAPIWGFGQLIMLGWMTKVVDPISKRASAEASNPFAWRFNALPWVVATGLGLALYVSYRMGHTDGVAHLSEMVRRNCEFQYPNDLVRADKCHRNYSFDIEAALAKAEKVRK